MKSLNPALDVGEVVYAFPDPFHMIKLVRNTFGERKVLITGTGGLIRYDFIERLLELQESEGLHLANK